MKGEQLANGKSINIISERVEKTEGVEFTRNQLLIVATILI